MRNRRYIGGAFIALNREQRKQLWSRITSGAGAKDGTERLQPGLRGRVRHLRGEKELRHGSLGNLIPSQQPAPTAGFWLRCAAR
jgi:hypothetical protein